MGWPSPRSMVGFHRYWLAYAIPPHRNGISNASFQQHTAQAYTQLGQSTPYGLLRGGPVWPDSCSVPRPTSWDNANGSLGYPGPDGRLRLVAGDRCGALRISDSGLTLSAAFRRIRRTCVATCTRLRHRSAWGRLGRIELSRARHRGVARSRSSHEHKSRHGLRTSWSIERHSATSSDRANRVREARQRAEPIGSCGAATR
jgi:hypothetical protein